MPISYIDYPSGYVGTKFTIERMFDLVAKGKANPKVLQTATIITRNIPHKDYHGEAAAIFDYVKKDVRYTRDPRGVELLMAPQITLERGAGDCVPLDQKVVLREKASGQYRLLPIGDIRETYHQYEALSYAMEAQRWTFSDITRWLDKGRRPLQKVSLRSGQTFRCTPDHKLWMLRKTAHDGPFCPGRMSLLEAARDQRSTTRGVMCAHKIPAGAERLSREQLLVEGLYAAEGFGHGRQGRIGMNNDAEIERLCSALAALGIPIGVNRRKDGLQTVSIKSSWLAARLTSLFGANSFEKRFPDNDLSLTEEGVQALLDAYASGDAYIPKPGSRWHRLSHRIYNTSSDILAEQVVFLHLVLGSPLSNYLQIRHGGSGKRPIWRLVNRRSSKQAHVERLPGIENGCIKKVSDDGEAEVCDISVAGTRNFVTPDGAVLSNCDDLAILIASLAEAVGMPTGFETVRASAQAPDEFTHVYAIIKTDRGWRAADPTVAGSWFGWRPSAGVYGRKIWTR